MDRQDVEAILAAGYEIRSFEVKGPGSVGDKAFVARVARAGMAMGNHRDGGLVCLGVDDKQIEQMTPGLDPAQTAGWSDYDNVSAALARYSDPPLTFRLHPLTLSSGAQVVILEVLEFEHVPHVCKLDYPGALQAGTTYVRSLRQPESVTVPSSTEMRELLDLATNKALRDFVARARAAGLSLSGAPAATEQELDESAFAAEAEQAWQQ